MWQKRAIMGGIGFVGLMMCMGIPKGDDPFIVERTQTKRVEIKGEVVNPGIYELAWDASVNDALLTAGGVNETGELSGINLSRSALHQEVIVVPPKQKTACISINTATKEELDRLPGVGEKMAERIIAQRETAPFRELQDLKRVKGIGDKTYEKLKDQICL